MDESANDFAAGMQKAHQILATTMCGIHLITMESVKLQITFRVHNALGDASGVSLSNLLGFQYATLRTVGPHVLVCIKALQDGKTMVEPPISDLPRSFLAEMMVRLELFLEATRQSITVQVHNTAVARLSAQQAFADLQRKNMKEIMALEKKIQGDHDSMKAIVESAKEVDDDGWCKCDLCKEHLTIQEKMAAFCATNKGDSVLDCIIQINEKLCHLYETFSSETHEESVKRADEILERHGADLSSMKDDALEREHMAVSTAIVMLKRDMESGIMGGDNEGKEDNEGNEEDENLS